MATLPSIFYKISPLTYFFIGLVVIWVLIAMSQRFRSIRLGGLANELGLRLFGRDPLNLPQRYTGMYLFKQGHARRARNVMIGHYQGQQLRLFDYVYETGLGLNRRTHRFGVAAVQVDNAQGALLVLAKKMGHAAYNLSGMEQIRLPNALGEQGYGAFGDNVSPVRDYLSEEVLSRLGQNPSCSLEIRDGVLAVYRPGRITLKEFRQLRALASELAGAIRPCPN